MFNIPELIDMFHGWYNNLVYSGSILFFFLFCLYPSNFWSTTPRSIPEATVEYCEIISNHGILILVEFVVP